ncbi:MAG: tRNA dihydrouridine synthase DusB [Pseudomonadota bacterium]
MSQLGDFGVSGPVILAPMAGITDRPFRRLCKRYGIGLVVSEMVASREVLEGMKSVRAKAELDADDGLTAVQIAGRERYWMAEAARFVADRGARIIDINMGCPAKKVTNGLSGSALMRDPDHALGLIAAVVDAVDVPVTLKMRLGWDRSTMTAPEIARRAAGAGVRAITVHGRTRCDFYTGRADWAAIRDVVDAVEVPVIANGDIVDAETASAALAASGAAAVMVGRGARGRPWLPGQIMSVLMGRAPSESPAVDPPGKERVALILEHLEAQCLHYGKDLGLRTIRKHLGWYAEAMPGGAALRSRLVRACSAHEIGAALNDWLARHEDGATAHAADTGGADRRIAA